MIKLTELKNAIKKNRISNMFYNEGLLKNLFSYNNRCIVSLEKMDIEKFYKHLQKENIANVNLEFKKIYINDNLINTFEKFKTESKKDNFLIDADIVFKQEAGFKSIEYRLLKSKNGLYKLETELIKFLDYDKLALYTNEDNHNLVYIYNDFNDFIGFCMIEKCTQSELLELIEL